MTGSNFFKIFIFKKEINNNYGHICYQIRRLIHTMLVMIARVQGIKLFNLLEIVRSHVKAKYMTNMIIPAVDET
jgi:hypothetical protein